MNRIVPLDIDEHFGLQVITKHSAQFGDNINNVILSPSEILEAQKHYPILFSKNPNGDLQTIALLGLEKDENLFLETNGWNANYIPAICNRGPFLINSETSTFNNDLNILINLDSPRLSKTEGESIFLEHGGNSKYLETIIKNLKILQNYEHDNQEMINTFLECNLIAPLDIEIEFKDGVILSLPDFFYISSQGIKELSPIQLDFLNKKSYLEKAIFIASSISNLNRLIELKNRNNANA